MAVFLSMVVVFGFQSVFSPKTKEQAGFSQNIENKDVIEHKISRKMLDPVQEETGASDVSAPKRSEESLFQEQVYNSQAGAFDVSFSNKGGNIQDIRITAYGYDVPVNRFANFQGFADKPFEYQKISSTQYVMKYEGEGAEVFKRYGFGKETNIDIEVEIKNKSDKEIIISESEMMNINLSRLDKEKHSVDWTLYEYAIKTSEKIIRKDNANKFDEKWNKKESESVEWIGFRDRYFASIVRPEIVLNSYTIKVNDARQLSLGGSFPSDVIYPGQTKKYGFTVYLGPQKLDLLAQTKMGFEKIMVFSNWGWLDAISKAIYWMLGTIHKIIPSWGICIILISLIIYALMYPLTLKSLLSMKKMQALQPKMAELKKKHEKTPEKMNQEIMELYRKHGVNPISGCLPMLLQMPIFIGLYQVLWRSAYFRGEGFLWISDLSMPDRLIKLPFMMPFLGEYFNILPILMGIIMFFQQKMNMGTTASAGPEQEMQQKMMLYMMPILMGFIFYNFASGLCVYFVVFYALSGFTQWKISKMIKPVI